MAGKTNLEDTNRTAVEIADNNKDGSLQPNAEARKEEGMAKLQELSVQIKEYDNIVKSHEKLLDACKSEFKKIALDIGVDLVENEQVRITLNSVDKSFLDAEQTIEFLRKRNLNKYIHTKEYFMDEELTLAVSRNEISAQDLAPYLIKKTETRMNIKKK